MRVAELKPRLDLQKKLAVGRLELEPLVAVANTNSRVLLRDRVLRYSFPFALLSESAIRMADYRQQRSPDDDDARLGRETSHQTIADTEAPTLR
jgi:hypothetical protein